MVVQKQFCSRVEPNFVAFVLPKDEEILELKLDAFGDFSSILNAAKKIVKGKIGEDELVEVLTDCIALSQTPDGAMFFGDKDAKNFTRDVVASMKRLLKRHIRKHRLGQVQVRQKLQSQSCFICKRENTQKSSHTNILLMGYDICQNLLLRRFLLQQCFFPRRALR